MSKNKDVHDQDKKEGKRMAVSMGVIPTITGVTAKKMLEALKKPTIDKKLLDECEKLSQELFEGIHKE